MAIRFDGRVAIVTGAGRGLGRAYALGLANLGARLVVNDLGAALDGTGGASEAAEAVVEEIRKKGGEAVADGASVADEDGVAELVGRAMDAYGRIDILISNAGILRDRTLAKMTIEEFDEVIDVHLRGAWRVTRAVWPIMREQSYGRIVMATSSSGLYGNFGQANYAAAKLGLVGLVNTLRIEGERHGIRCNAIAPVAFTRMTRESFPPGTEQVLSPDRVVPGMLFLCSEDAPNGSIVAAGGGGFAVARIVESPGCFVGPDASADDVARAWPRIADPQGEAPLFSAGEQTTKFLDLTNGSQPPE